MIINNKLVAEMIELQLHWGNKHKKIEDYKKERRKVIKDIHTQRRRETMLEARQHREYVPYIEVCYPDIEQLYADLRKELSLLSEDSRALQYPANLTAPLLSNMLWEEGIGRLVDIDKVEKELITIILHKSVVFGQITLVDRREALDKLLTSDRYTMSLGLQRLVEKIIISQL